MARTDGRLAGLDGLRGIAACWVMLYHYTAWFAHPAPGPTLAFPTGHLGVELFFIISGFVIPLSLSRASTLGTFAWARLARLYPTFLASLVVTIVMTLALAPAPLDPARLLANLTMMPELFGARCIDGSAWSLLYEIVFYALAATAWLGLGCRAPERPCLAWMAVALAVRLGSAGAGVTTLTQLTAASFAHLFVIGVMLARIHAGEATRLTWLVLFVALDVTLLGPHWSFQPISRLGFTVTIAGFTLLVWFATTRRGAILAAGPLGLLGRISYPLYLVNQAAGFALIERLEEAGVSPDAAIALAIAWALGTAWAISTAIEWPVQRWLAARRNRPAWRYTVSSASAQASSTASVSSPYSR